MSNICRILHITKTLKLRYMRLSKLKDTDVG